MRFDTLQVELGLEHENLNDIIARYPPRQLRNQKVLKVVAAAIKCATPEDNQQLVTPWQNQLTPAWQKS